MKRISIILLIVIIGIVSACNKSESKIKRISKIIDTKGYAIINGNEREKMAKEINDKYHDMETHKYYDQPMMPNMKYKLVKDGDLIYKSDEGVIVFDKGGLLKYYDRYNRQGTEGSIGQEKKATEVLQKLIDNKLVDKSYGARMDFKLVKGKLVTIAYPKNKINADNYFNAISVMVSQKGELVYFINRDEYVVNDTKLMPKVTAEQAKQIAQKELDFHLKGKAKVRDIKLVISSYVHYRNIYKDLGKEFTPLNLGFSNISADGYKYVYWYEVKGFDINTGRHEATIFVDPLNGKVVEVNVES